MKNKWTKRYVRCGVVVLFIIFWSVLLYYVNPARIVAVLGIENSYAIAFFAAIFGTLATITVVSFYPAIVTLALGGVNPIILGIIAGAGMTIGNGLYFYFGSKRRVIVSHRLTKKMQTGINWLNTKSPI